MKSFAVDFASLDLRREDIYRNMAMGDYTPEPDIAEYVEQMIKEAAGFTRPKFCYKICGGEVLGQRSMLVEDRTFDTGSVITRYMKDADAYVLFIATAGVEYDRWLHDIKQQGDIFREFIADSIGSEIAESTAREMIKSVEGYVSDKSWNVSNSYSPGYCGWHVKGQRELFEVMGENDCGVTLNDSCLMSPVKSVSGILAVGANVEKKPYGCEICAKVDCYKNKHKKK